MLAAIDGQRMKKAETSVLVGLNVYGGSAVRYQLENLSDMSGSSVTSALTKLRERGIVERRVNPYVGRSGTLDFLIPLSRTGRPGAVGKEDKHRYLAQNIFVLTESLSESWNRPEFRTVMEEQGILTLDELMAAIDRVRKEHNIEPVASSLRTPS